MRGSLALLEVISGVGVVCCCGNVGYNLSLSIEEAGPEQLRESCHSYYGTSVLASSVNT